MGGDRGMNSTPCQGRPANWVKLPGSNTRWASTLTKTQLSKLYPRVGSLRAGRLFHFPEALFAVIAVGTATAPRKAITVPVKAMRSWPPGPVVT